MDRDVRASLSESSRKSTKAKNNAGRPIRLKSKLLAVEADPFNPGAVYVAEAAGLVRRIVLETSAATHILRPTTVTPSPITCLGILATPSGHGTVFAGSWDSSVYAWPIQNGLPAQTGTTTAVLKQHKDFVKALLVLPSTSSEHNPLLASASADKSIVIWDAVTFETLHVLNGHTRGVQALSFDPLSLSSNLGVVVASGDSNQEIRFWRVSRASANQISVAAAASESLEEEEGQSVEEEAVDAPEVLVVHETSIYALHYLTSGDLWTASADKDAKRLSRADNFKPDTVLSHSDYVKAIVVNENADIVVTAGRDENVNVWDSATGKSIGVLEGHWEEVTALALVDNGKRVVSVSIDGTIRQWSLDKADILSAIHTYQQPQPDADERKQVSLTADEEKELAELMDSDDED